MNYKKVLPAVALTLGMSSQIAAQAELFQMTEVSGHGLLIACEAHQGADKKVGADEHKCAAGACGADHKGAKACEHHCSADKHEKGDAHKCAADKKDDHHCGADHHEKSDAHKCAADKKDDAAAKTDEHKCAAGACGAHH